MLSLNEIEKQQLIEFIAPLGCVPRYDAAMNSLLFSCTPARRFILDGTRVLQRARTSALVNAQAYNPKYIGIGIREALGTIIQTNYDLYLKLYQYIAALDAQVAQDLQSCEQAALILSHSSFGKELFTHIHARSEPSRPTLSVFINLSGADTSTLTLYTPVHESSRGYQEGYTDQRVLAIHARNVQHEEITIHSGDCILFNASRVPHKYKYSNDLWLTLVYDHVQGLELDSGYKLTRLNP